MINEVFEVEEIDEYGRPWVSKWWSDEKEEEHIGHDVALESYEFLLVKE